MTKQPDPGRPKRRRWTEAPSPPPPMPEPAGPKLETIAPTLRSPIRTSSTKSSRRSNNPFEQIFGRPDVDLDSLQRALSTEQGHQNDSPPNSFADRFQRNRNPFSSLLISTAVHLAIFLTMTFFMLHWPPPNPGVNILASIDSTPLLENQVDSNTKTVEIQLPDQNQSPVEMSFDDTSVDEKIADAQSHDVVPNVATIDESPNPNDHEVETAPHATLPTGGGLEGRDLKARAQLAGEKGGTQASEAAVESGLRWIVAHQHDDGSWRLKHDDGKCNGECGNEGTQESTTAATGLALMAILGAGYTHKIGPYQEEVQKGLDYLVKSMRVSTNGGRLVQGDNGMYSHALATIAISEAYIMTKDTSLCGPFESARKYIETAQHRKGGWRYVPGTVGDMTVTGWQIMALNSCQRGGARTGELVWTRANDFINSLGSSSGCYGYQKPEENPTTTAVGILSKMYLGADLEDHELELGTRFVADQGPSRNDMYFNYYATQILHHRNDPSWPDWNEEMRDYLVATQDRSNGHSAGSWYFPDVHGQVGGRLYTTAMAVMTLEVYYRFLPLYEKGAIQTSLEDGESDNRFRR